MGLEGKGTSTGQNRQALGVRARTTKSLLIAAAMLNVPAQIHKRMQIAFGEAGSF
jgi:hypothetical protein